MRNSAKLFVAGLGALGTAGLSLFGPSVASDAPPSKTFLKLGLWEVKRNSNIPLFVATGRSAEVFARRSDEIMNGPGYTIRICLMAAQQQRIVASSTHMDDCDPKAAKLVDTASTVDMVCKGRNIHVVVVRAADDHHVISLSAKIDDPAEPNHNATSQWTFDSPEHFRNVTTLTGPDRSVLGVAMISKLDAHWVSADCGDLPPGASRLPNGTLVTPKLP